ncbi:MAG: UbiA family prenyltransferase [Candidatus Thorarchaeota archaeon]
MPADYHHCAAEGDIHRLYVLIALSLAYASLLVAVQITDPTAVLLFLSWLTLSVLYSARPVRFKARPILDFSSNFLYVIPALLAYYQASGLIPNWVPVLGAFTWTAAMHLFSAIPDIESDRSAGIRTTAVVLGKKSSLVLCFMFWSLFSVILIVLTPWNPPYNLMMLVYPAIPLVLLLRPSISIDRVYWYFPYYTGLFGMVMTLSFMIRLVL